MKAMQKEDLKAVFTVPYYAKQSVPIAFPYLDRRAHVTSNSAYRVPIGTYAGHCCLLICHLRTVEADIGTDGPVCFCSCEFGSRRPHQFKGVAPHVAGFLRPSFRHAQVAIGPTAGTAGCFSEDF